MKVLVSLGAILMLAGYLQAQQVPRVYTSPDGRIIGAANLQYESNNFMCLVVGPVSGTIANVGKDGPNGEEFWIDVRTDQPLKIVRGRIINSVTASTRNVFGISIPAAFKPVGGVVAGSLLKRGHRVRLVGWNCGAGGFLSVRSILIDPKLQDSFVDTSETLNALSGRDAENKLTNLRSDIASSMAVAEAEFDREIAPGMRTGPKEEFETSWAAETRLRKLESLRVANHAIYESKIVKSVVPKISEYAQLLHGVYPTAVKAEIGSYDADVQEFPISSGGQHMANVKVPLLFAKELKDRFSEAETYVDYGFADGDDEGEFHFSPIRVRVVYKGKQFVGDFR